MRLLIVSLMVFMIMCVPAYAAPSYSIDEYTPLYLTLHLGQQLCFDYMWDVGSDTTSGPWDAFNLHIWAGPTWLGSYYSNSDSGWLSGCVDIPSGYWYTDTQLRFSVDDFGQDTDPVVHLKNLQPIPEPSTLILLGGGLAGLFYRYRSKYRRRSKT